MAHHETGTLKARGRKLLKKLIYQRHLQIMILLVMAYLFIFCYLPIFGLQIAFKDFMFNKGIWGSPFTGLKHFRAFFTDPNIWPALKNTLGISLIKVFLMFPLPIFLALLLNEVSNKMFKKVVQTISYFPYFISWSIISVLATNWLSTNTGFVNALLLSIGILDKPIFFLGEPRLFWWISYTLDVWKTIGWASIIYLAAIVSIDSEIFEAAYIDGASRMQMIVHITLPSIMSTIMILFILNVGSMLGGGLYGSNFQISYLLGNLLNSPASEILDTYILKIGITLGRYSYAAAVGLLTSIVSFILLISTNFASKKLTGESFM